MKSIKDIAKGYPFYNYLIAQNKSVEDAQKAVRDYDRGKFVGEFPDGKSKTIWLNPKPTKKPTRRKSDDSKGSSRSSKP